MRKNQYFPSAIILTRASGRRIFLLFPEVKWIFGAIRFIRGIREWICTHLDFCDKIVEIALKNIGKS